MAIRTAEPNKAKKKKKLPFKQRMKRYALYGVIGIVALITLMVFFPYYGTMNYGICRTFVELQEPYPPSIQFTHAVDDTASNLVTIYYKRVDPFGLESLNVIQCVFKTDENGYALSPPQLSKIDINGKKREYPQEAKEIVENFNKGIPGIMDNPPDLIMPYTFMDDIKSYR